MKAGKLCVCHIWDGGQKDALESLVCIRKKNVSSLHFWVNYSLSSIGLLVIEQDYSFVSPKYDCQC